jgi:hypothetical protein
MAKNRLAILVPVTIAVLLAGLWISESQQGTESAGSSAPLIPDLSSRINEVKSLKISGAGGTLIAELARGDSGWTVVNRHNYPADVSKVREYLLALADSKVREEKTRKPENYARLGVVDPAKPEATGQLVEIGGLPQPVGLIVGISASTATPGTFVRRVGEEPALLVSGQLVPDKESGNWLVKEIVDLPSDQIRSVAVTAPDGSVVRIEKTDPAAFNFTVLDIPKGRKLVSESSGNLIGGALASLNLEDVAPASEREPDPASTWKAVYTTHPGLVVEVTLWDVDGKVWSRYAARLDEERLAAWVDSEKAKADAARATAEAEAEAKAKAEGQEGEAKAAPADELPKPFDAEKALADKRAELEKAIAEINARTSGWSYQIPTWKAANIRKKMIDLLEAEPKK